MFNLAEKSLKDSHVKNRLCQREFRACFDLVAKALHFLRVATDSSCIRSDAHDKAGGFTDRFPTDVDAVIQAVYHVGQTNRIDIEHSRCIDVIARMVRISGGEEKITETEGIGSQQVRLHAEKIFVSTG